MRSQRERGGRELGHDGEKVPAWRVLLAGTNGLLWGLVPFAIVLNMVEESVHERPPDSWTDWGAGVLLVLILGSLTYSQAEWNVGLPPRGRRGAVARGWLVGGSAGVLGACALQLGNDWLHPRMSALDDGLLALGALGLLVVWGLLLANGARPGPWIPWLTGLAAETRRVERHGRRPTERPVAPKPGPTSEPEPEPEPKPAPAREPAPRRPRRPLNARQLFWATAALGAVPAVVFTPLLRYAVDSAEVPPWLALLTLLIMAPVAIATLVLLVSKPERVSGRRKLVLVGSWLVLAPLTWLVAGTVEVGDPVRRVWAAEAPAGAADVAGRDITAGAWVLEDTVVRLTAWGLTAYDVADGAERWSWRPDGGRLLCAAAERPTERLLLLAVRAPEAERCGEVLALDPARGEPLWSGDFAGGPTFRADAEAPDGWELADERPGVPDEPPGTGQLTLAGPAAVLREASGGYRALDAADGTPLWAAEAAEGCHPVGAAGDDEALVTAEFCTDDAGAAESGRRIVVSRRDPADGAVLSAHPLPHGYRPGDFGVLSVRPLVVRAGGTPHAVPEGPGPEWPAVESPAADGGTVQIDAETDLPAFHPALRRGAFSAVPLREAVVVDGLLVTHSTERYTVRSRGSTSLHSRSTVRAHALADGAEVWRSDTFDGAVVGLSERDGRVTVLARESGRNATTLRSFRADDGAEVRSGRLHPSVGGDEPQLFAELGSGEGWLLLNQGELSADGPLLHLFR
ncbi:PQQ-binding-like beta-propeller repeat protein [Streptomyces sp. 3MP-14]|uniref:PQQ-binding-like beta-propeller repeat protein n=1 Tax=Streptomyces mimosae TaxID=2586635 RepID=A0A5N6AG16_9ACTN|nr:MULTISPECIES: PQQ-binding-like beta-propeller repeat protein [Streptomyces]KAB8167112.1 PQQ-binding-like beta-propeller repeat protein [Streptomyces mimosae]KAB8177053.1 PQQ-binding-like beta-propeller repeat protein [Streptomyces sp. 3MP-14]